jgi:hypothetical protein
MQKPMTTDDIHNAFPGSAEEDEYDEFETLLSSTCSMTCPKCRKRNWFMGSWGNEDIPLEWECPGCHQIISLRRHTA